MSYAILAPAQAKLSHHSLRKRKWKRKIGTTRTPQACRAAEEKEVCIYLYAFSCSCKIQTQDALFCAMPGPTVLYSCLSSGSMCGRRSSNVMRLLMSTWGERKAGAQVGRGKAQHIYGTGESSTRSLWILSLGCIEISLP